MTGEWEGGIGHTRSLLRTTEANQLGTSQISGTDAARPPGAVDSDDYIFSRGEIIVIGQGCSGGWACWRFKAGWTVKEATTKGLARKGGDGER